MTIIVEDHTASDGAWVEAWCRPDEQAAKQPETRHALWLMSQHPRIQDLTCCYPPNCVVRLTQQRNYQGVAKVTTNAQSPYVGRDVESVEPMPSVVHEVGTLGIVRSCAMPPTVPEDMVFVALEPNRQQDLYGWPVGSVEVVRCWGGFTSHWAVEVVKLDDDGMIWRVLSALWATDPDVSWPTAQIVQTAASALASPIPESRVRASLDRWHARGLVRCTPAGWRLFG